MQNFNCLKVREILSIKLQLSNKCERQYVIKRQIVKISRHKEHQTKKYKSLAKWACLRFTATAEKMTKF